VCLLDQSFATWLKSISTKVLVNIFGRETLVEMDFSQVAKL